MAPKRKAKKEEVSDEEEEDHFEEEEEEKPKKKKAPAKKKAQVTQEEIPGWSTFGASLLVRDVQGPGAAKIAGFDFDGTLVTVPSGRDFALDEHDWAHFNKEVIPKLKKYHADGYKIVIFSNQAAIKSALGGVMSTKVRKRMNHCMQPLTDDGIPWQAFCATQKDEYRKPLPGMWELMVNNFNDGVAPDMEASFFVGDFAGRPRDKESTDRQFAEGLGLEFRTPEDEFGGVDLTIVGGGAGAGGGVGGDGVNPNTQLINLLSEFGRLVKMVDPEKGFFKAAAYNKAADELRKNWAQRKIDLDNYKQIKIKGVGDKTIQKIKEYLASDETEFPGLQELREEANEDPTALLQKQAAREQAALMANAEVYEFL